MILCPRYRAHTRGQDRAGTVADLERLAAAKVLQRDGDTVGFHDLQHDYLLLHAPLLSDLHARCGAPLLVTTIGPVRVIGGAHRSRLAGIGSDRSCATTA